MIKLLEQAIEKVKILSEDRQRYAAELLEEVASIGDDVYPLSPEESRLVREALEQLDRGEVASDTEVRAVFDKYRA